MIPSIEIKKATCPECLQREIVVTDGPPMRFSRHREPAPRNKEGRYAWDNGHMVLGNWCPGSGELLRPFLRARVDMSKVSEPIPVVNFAGVEIWVGVDRSSGESLMLRAKHGPKEVCPGGSWLPVPGTNLRTMIPTDALPGEFVLEEADWREP
jgi:hypothetical protein